MLWRIQADKQVSEFEEGVLYAASILVAIHDVPVMAATILREAGLENADCSGMDEHEKKSLRKINKEKGIALRGLMPIPMEEPEESGILTGMNRTSGGWIGQP